MKKRLLAAVVAMAMLLGSVGALAVAPPSDLNDVSDLNQLEALYALVWLDIVAGYPDGAFRPAAALTRAEACKLFAEAMLLHDKSTTFTDLSGHWAADYISLCSTQGLIDGDEDGNFNPNEAITQLDFAKMVLRMTGMSGTDDEVYEKAVEFGILEDVSYLGRSITRGEAVLSIYNAIKHPIGENGATALATLRATKLMQNGKGLLRPFVLVGQAENGQVNGMNIDESALVLTFDSASNGYIAAEVDFSALLYNFAALYDTDENGKADSIIVVMREDGEKFWDESAGYGEDFEREYNIPYGERMLGFANASGNLSGATEDYSNITARGDLAGSKYWATYDWYNTTSTDTLTMLTNFKTIQQASGWACGTTSALMLLEWYGMRDGLNENDLSVLRDKVINDKWTWGGYTDTKMLVSMFGHLNKMAGEDIWTWVSTYDFVDADGNLDESYLSTAWIKENLALGRPILVGWDDWGGHWQVIIGYDDMGTEYDTDDVVLLADPYDSTDHLNDGVIIQPYQRLYWNWTQGFDRDFGIRNGGAGMPVIFMPVPAAGYDYTPVMGDGLAVIKGEKWANAGTTDDDMLIPYGDTADYLDTAERYVYTLKQRGENGLAGPASSDWYRGADVAKSPYYAGYDFFGTKATEISESLMLLEGFQTSQQASEWTCGPASLRMVLNWFEEPVLLNEFKLSAMRENDKEGATTLDGMIDILKTYNEVGYGAEWAWISTDDMGDDWDLSDDLGLDYGENGGLIPYFISRGIPVIVGWNEWGGHWMVIIGFDDMGTEDTQDDVIILADPYDTTDHCQDGYVIESYERLIYGWTASFDERGSELFLVAAPAAVLASAGF